MLCSDMLGCGRVRRVLCGNGGPLWEGFAEWKNPRMNSVLSGEEYSMNSTLMRCMLGEDARERNVLSGEQYMLTVLG